MTHNTIQLFEISSFALDTATRRVRKGGLSRKDFELLIVMWLELNDMVGHDVFWINKLLPDYSTDYQKAPEDVRRKTLKRIGNIEVDCEFYRYAWSQNHKFYSISIKALTDTRKPLRLIVERVNDKLVVLDFMPRGDDYDRSCFDRCCNASSN